MRYHALPISMFTRVRGQTVPRIQWRVVDMKAGEPNRVERVALCADEGMARLIAETLNGNNPQNDAAWQRCLDRVNANAEAARLERDEARASLEKLIGQPSPADNEVLLALARHINRVCFKE